LDFQDIKVRAVLELLAKFSGTNIIASDQVTGNITLHLQNIAWQDALAVILRSEGLGEQRVGNTLLIAPLSEIASHEEQRLETEQQIQALEPLHSVLIPIKYGKAADIITLLKTQSNTLLSERGSVSADARTNTIWVQDTPQKLLEVQAIINRLDIPVRQVLIEARIVNVDSQFEEDLGVRFGTAVMNAGDASDAVTTDEPIAQRLHVDLPAQGTSVSGGAASMGLALIKLGDDSMLDLELSALQSEGGGEIISSPRLITADQQAADILSGEEIPYQQFSTLGATNVAFKNAVLRLNVMPHITPNGKIILTLKLNQDKASSQLVQGVPAIDTRQIETQVWVDNGQTVVLGGIYETLSSNDVQRVPFLSALPVVGGLFRHTLIANKRTELLIFVTPHIIQASDIV
jgi:type IV pilus assembly protein PilQ